MKGLEIGKDKVKKICEALKKETLEPAKQEAEEVVQQAKRRADEIVIEAKQHADKLVDQAKQEIEKQRAIFHSSLSHASKQAVATLREKIENELFAPELGKIVTKQMQDPALLGRLLNVIVEAIQKEGIGVELEAYVPSAVSTKEINQLLTAQVVARLREKGVLLSALGGGVEVRLVKENITLSLSDEVVKELLGSYIRKDFQSFVFGT